VVVRIRTWWQAMMLGLVLGAVIGALYGAVLSVLPGQAWYATMPAGQTILAGAALGVCYGAASGLAGAITLAVDARLARDPASRSGLAVRVAAAIGVVVAFLVVTLVAELLGQGINLSDVSLLVLVGVPAVLPALAAALVAPFAFQPTGTGSGA